jgi:predicted ATP-grasp superfamily ATP-dependent carboligase
VVLKSVAHGGLGIVRSLGRLGVEVHTVEADPWTPAFYSRYNRGKLWLDVETAPVEPALQQLESLANRIGRRPLLIPTTDNATIFVDAHAAQLCEWFRFPRQPHGLVERLCSKREMYSLARQFGIPTAQTLFPQNRDEVLRFLSSAEFPIMLKAIDGTRLYQRFGKKMFIVRSRKELLEFYDRMESPEAPNLMLQEYIPGGDDTVWMFNGYFNADSECLAGFTGKKIRQSPVYTGSTTLGVCLRNDPVDDLTRRFMKSVGYRGILDVGYRYDARDGQFKVLDVNPRIGATFRLFVGDGGLDVARAFYLDMTGQQVPASRPFEGRKWLVEDRDLASSLRYWQDGNLTLARWLTSFAGVQETAYLTGDDILPVLARATFDLTQGARRISRHFCRPLSKIAKQPDCELPMHSSSQQAKAA